jgi:hypothetical protein
MFQHGSFWMWVKRQKIQMSQFRGHFVLGDLRKFAEQKGDIIQRDQPIELTSQIHGVSAFLGAITFSCYLSVLMTRNAERQETSALAYNVHSFGGIFWRRFVVREPFKMVDVKV